MKICPVGAELIHVDRQADQWTKDKRPVPYIKESD